MSLWDTSMVHKQGITPVSDQHLQRRNGVYYYRRRVPLQLVAKLGKKFVQVSLHTTSLKEAKKRRTLRDLEWDAKFAALSSPAHGGDDPAVQTPALTQPLSENELLQLVRDYVARQDQLARKREVTDYPENPAQRAEMAIEDELESQILQSREHPQTQQWIYLAGQEALKAIGRSFEDPAIPGEALAELVRRALLELPADGTPGLSTITAARSSTSCSMPAGPPKRDSANSPSSACGWSRRMRLSISSVPRAWIGSAPPWLSSAKSSAMRPPSMPSTTMPVFARVRSWLACRPSLP